MKAKDRKDNGVKMLLLVLFLGLALRAFLASLDMKILLPNLVSDDMFYYLKLAGNLAAGSGASFDGINPTNGFHPLYALMLTFMYSMGNFGVEAPVRIALLILSVFDLMTGLVIYRIMLLPAFGGNRKNALIAAVFWIFNPFVISGTFYGLETAISTFLVMLAVYSYLRIRDLKGSVNRHVWLGVIIGFAMLARMDSIFLAFAISVDLLAKKKLGKIFLVLGPSFLIVSPWLLWSFTNFGMVQQDSGAVLAFMNKFSNEGLLQSVYLAVRILVMYLTSMALPIGLVIALKLAGKVKLKTDYRRLFLNFIILFSLLLTVYYPMLMGGVTRRYYQPLLAVAALFIGLASTRLKDRMQTLFAIFLIANLAVTGVYYWNYRASSPQAWHSDLYDAAMWLSIESKPGDKIGGFNSGIMGYFSNRTVVNLDGVMNHNAYLAITNRNLFSYIKGQNIKYLVDNQNSFEAIKPFMGTEYMGQLKLAYKKPLKENEDQYVVVYEVVY